MLPIIFAVFRQGPTETPPGHRPSPDCSRWVSRKVRGLDRISIFFDHRKSPLATPPRRAPVLGLARQNHPVKNLPGSELRPRASHPPPRRAVLPSTACLQASPQILV